MTPLFFLVVFALGLVMAVFRHPLYGLYTYLFTFYMSPNHSWWSDAVPELRYLLIIGVVTLVSALRQDVIEGRPHWLTFTASKLLVALVIWMWCQYFWALDQAEHLEGTIEFTKHIIIFFLIYRIINSKERIVSFLLVHIVGCFWFGYLALGASGGRLESIGGPVGGANELGIHVTTAMITGGIMWLILSGWRRYVIFFAIPLIANTIVLTVSRGAFLGFFAAGGIGTVFIPGRYRGRYIGLGILALILISLLAHDALIERFTSTIAALTGQEEPLDNSASSRIVIFNAGMQMGMDYPLGSGHRGTRVLSPRYMPVHVLARKSGGRSAHNTFAAVFAEHGYPGAAIYLFLVLWVIKTLFRVVRAKEHIASSEDRALLVALIAAILGMWVSGNFSNCLFTETQYWLLALLCSLLSLTLDAKRKPVRRSSEDLAVNPYPSSVVRTSHLKATPRR